MNRLADPHVLQFCHGYDGPFLDCARQYARLFAGTGTRVTTVFLTGLADKDIAAGCASDDVFFLEYSSSDIRGLKLGAIADFRKIAASRAFTLCIAHRYKPAYIALLATGLPVIAVHHAFGDYYRPGRKLFAWLFRKRLSLLGVSDAVRDDIRANLKAFSVLRIQTLYNRIDIEQLRAEHIPGSRARELLGLPADAFIVANVGRLHPDKDQATLIKGFAKALPDMPANCVLVILGSGRLDQRLRELASELGIADRVLMLGQVANARRYFGAFDVFVLSSDHEPFGMVLLEAMAAGVPLLATACGGAKEVVEGVGILFPFADSEALAQGLLQLASLTDAQRADCRSRMANRLLETYCDDAVSEEFLRLATTTKFSPALLDHLQSPRG